MATTSEEEARAALEATALPMDGGAMMSQPLALDLNGAVVEQPSRAELSEALAGGSRAQDYRLRDLLAVLIDAARARGDREVALSAQTHALGFYRRFGFTNEGPEYIEAGIPHQAMRRVF